VSDGKGQGRTVTERQIVTVNLQLCEHLCYASVAFWVDSSSELT